MTDFDRTTPTTITTPTGRVGAWLMTLARSPHTLSAPEPADKTAVVGFLKRNAAVPGRWSFEIEPKGIRVHGNVAVTHYLIHTTVKNASGTGIAHKRTTRITHTWIRDDSQWKILGGMSSRR